MTLTHSTPASEALLSSVRNDLRHEVECHIDEIESFISTLITKQAAEVQRLRGELRTAQEQYGLKCDEKQQLVEQLTQTRSTINILEERLAQELASKQIAFDEAQSRYESLYQTRLVADRVVEAIDRIVARRAPHSALAFWRDDYGMYASYGSTAGVASGSTLLDVLTTIEALLKVEDSMGAQNTCAPHQESDLVLRPIDAFKTEGGMRGLAQMQRRWVQSMPWRDKTPLEALALIASEVGEAVNECRGDVPTPELGAELADIVLRVFDLAEMLKIDIEAKCRVKMAHNIEKGNLKGRGV